MIAALRRIELLARDDVDRVHVRARRDPLARGAQQRVVLAEKVRDQHDALRRPHECQRGHERLAPRGHDRLEQSRRLGDHSATRARRQLRPRPSRRARSRPPDRPRCAPPPRARSRSGTPAPTSLACARGKAIDADASSSIVVPSVARSFVMRRKARSAAREQLPVEPPRIVALAIRPILGELGRDAALSRAMRARRRPADRAARGPRHAAQRVEQRAVASRERHATARCRSAAARCATESRRSPAPR